jgi:hypothetical protein
MACLCRLIRPTRSTDALHGIPEDIALNLQLLVLPQGGA